MNLHQAHRITAPLAHETKPVTEMTEAEQETYWRIRRDEFEFWERNYETKEDEHD